MTADQAQPLEHDHAGARAEAQRGAGPVVGHRRPHAEHARGDGLALGGEIGGEAAQLGDLVVDRGRRDERAEAVAPRDQIVALEQFERLAERHEGDAEVAREASLVGQRRPRRPLALADALTERVGDAVVARQPSVHSTPLSVF